MKSTLTQKVSLAKDVLIQNLAGEAVLLDLKSENYFSLDDVGTKMLSVLTESESIQMAYESLQTQYEVEPEQLRKDLLDYIKKLLEDGLVEVTGA